MLSFDDAQYRPEPSGAMGDLVEFALEWIELSTALFFNLCMC